MAGRLNNTSKQLLLDNSYAPMTREFGLININIDAAVDAYVEWLNGMLGQGERIEVKHASGGIRRALEALPPLANWPTRQMFVQTDEPDWVAVFENCATTPDHSAMLRMMATRLGYRTLKVNETPDTMNNATGEGTWGARILHYFAPDSERLIRLARADGGAWGFAQYGAVQPFENPSLYASRQKADRFTHEMLLDYLGALGLQPFSEDFYPVQGDQFLVERVVPNFARENDTFTLAEARRGQEDSER